MRIKNSLKNIYSGLISQVIIMLFSFITRTFFIHYLGKDILGLSGLFSNILNLFSILELGIGQAINLKLYKSLANKNEEQTTSLINLYRKLYLYIAFIILILSLGFTPFIQLFIKGPVDIANLKTIYILFIVSSVLPYFYAYKSALIIADEKNYIISRINYIVSISSNLLEIFILILTKSYIAYLIVAISFSLVQNIYISIKLNKLYPYLSKGKHLTLSKSDKKVLFSDVRILTLYKLGTISLNYTDNIIMSAFIGLSTVGIYSNYNLLIGSVSALLSAVFQSLVASIGNLNATESKEKKLFIFNVINLGSFLFYGLSSVCLLTLLNPFLTFWLGKGYTFNNLTVLIIVLSFYISGMLFAPCNFRQTLGLFMYGKYRPIISALLNLIISIALVQKLGIGGVILGTIITRVLTNLWYDPYLIYKLEFKISLMNYFKKYFAYFLTTAFACFISLVICNNFTGNTLMIIIFKGLICVVVFTLISSLLFIKSDEMQYLIKILRRKY